MPVYDIELSDGRKVKLESDHEPTEKEVLEQLGAPEAPPGEHTALGTAARTAAMGLGPGAAAAAAFAPGAEAGAAIGSVAGPVGTAVGGLLGGVVTSAGAAIGAEYAQHKALEKVAPQFLKETEEAVKQHPIAGAVGSIASAAPSFEIAPGTVYKGLRAVPSILRGEATAAEKKFARGAAAQIGTQLGLTTAQTGLLEHRVPTPGELLEAAATASIFGHPRFGIPVPKALRMERPYASKEQEAAAVHGDVRTQPGQGAGQVPVQRGGPGVQPRAEAVAEGTQIPLGTPEVPEDIPRFSGSDETGWTLHFRGSEESGFESKKEAQQAAMDVAFGKREMPKPEGAPLSREQVLKNRQADAARRASSITEEEAQVADELERLAIDEGNKQGSPVTPVDKFTNEDPNVPFGKAREEEPTGTFLRATGTGAELHRGEWRTWIAQLMRQGLSRRELRRAVVSRVGEEKFHNLVMGELKDPELQKYWDALTGPEKDIEHYIYTGSRERPKGLSDVAMAHEAIRRRLQQAHGMTPSEFAETIGKEHVKIRTLDFLGRILRNGRELIGREGSTEAKALYDRAISNIDYAKSVLGGGRERREEPGARNRQEMIADRKRYEEVQAEVKSYNAKRQWPPMTLMQEWENLKNKYEGYPPPEVLTAAAYRTPEGTVETGANHPEILDRLRVKGFESPESRNTPDFGFVTQSGRFVTREEAGPLSTRSGQNLKEFEPGEPVHSDEVESPTEPGVPISETQPGARRREPEMFEKMPWELGVPVWEAMRKAGEAGVGDEPIGGNVQIAIIKLATTPEAKWPLPEGLKDQMHAWFMDQRGGRMDRVSMISNAIDREVNRPMRDEEDLVESNKKVEELDQLRKRVIASERAKPEEYKPAARRRKQDIREEPLLFGGLTAKGEQAAPGEAPKAVPETERAVPEGVMLPSYTANQIAEVAQRIYNSPKPSFRTFQQWAKRNIGNVPSAPLFGVWMDTVSANVHGQPGAKLKEMVEKLGLRSRVFPFVKQLPTKPLTPIPQELLKGVTPLESKQYIDVDIPDAREVPPDPRDLPPSMLADLRTRIKEQFPKASERDLEKLMAAQEAKARSAWMKLTPPDVREQKIAERKAIQRGQKLRAKAVSAIFQKLIEEGMPDTVDLSRKEIAIDDLDWSNPNAKEGVWRDIRGDEANNIDKLNAIFKDEARRSSFDNVNHTKRVAVLMNRQNGDISLVSAYPHGRTGTMVFDPSGATGIKGKPSVTLESQLRRWRPIASMLLREPIKDFFKHFKDIEEFNKYIGKDAQETERSFTYGMPEGATSWRDVPEWLQADYRSGMEGGYAHDFPNLEDWMGGEFEKGMARVEGVEETPEGTEFRFGTQVDEPAERPDRGKLTQRRPLSQREAMALMDFVTDESAVGKIETREDLNNILSELARRAENKTIKPREWAAISALRKAADETYRRENSRIRQLNDELRLRKQPADIPELSRTEAYKLALERFYDLIANTESREEYLARSMGQFSRPVREPQPFRGFGVSPPEAKGVSRELTAPEKIRPGLTQFPLPRTSAETEPRPPELLSPEAEQAVKEGAAKLIPYSPGSAFPDVPTGGEPVGGTKFAKRVEEGTHIPKKPAEFPHEAMVGIETSRKGTYVYGPPEFTMPKRRVLGPQRERPGARSRLSDEARKAYEDMMEQAVKFTAPMTRSYTNQEIVATRDGADRIVERYSNNQANEIRLASMKGDEKVGLWKRLTGQVGDTPAAKMIRRSAKAVLAAMNEASDNEWRRVNKAIEYIRKREFDYMEEKLKRNPDPEKLKELQEKYDRAKNNFIPYREPEWPENKHFDKLERQVDLGVERAKQMTEGKFPWTRWVGKKYLKAALALREEIAHARDHLNDPEMKETVATYKRVMDDHLKYMNSNGINIAGRDYYVPGRYDGEIWADHVITWGDMRILGRQYRLPKSFRNYYEAISKGPYMAVNADVADLAQHSLAAGGRVVEQNMWLQRLRHLTDPLSKKPVAVEPAWTKIHTTKEDPATGDMLPAETWTWTVPKGHEEYTLVYPTRNGKPVAVREGYRKLIESAMAQSAIKDMPGGKQALMLSQMLKHGVILILDTFHPSRLMQYSTALAGGKWYHPELGGWESGHAALTYSEASLKKAQELGLISKENIRWATEKINVRDRDKVIQMSRREVLEMALSMGLNATQTADTMYRNAVQHIPLIGERWNKILSPVNRFVFDKITPGMIATSFMKNFERVNAGERKIPLQRLMRETIRDMNVFYGNMGRQGIFRDPTFRDLAQILVLAPMWQEGLIGKELRAVSRLSGASWLAGRRGLGFENYMGPIVRGLARGLAAYFAASQVINLISRGKFTWQNEEEDHKLDAWVPTPWSSPDSGVWISPLSVFGEVTHDLWRLGQTKPTTWNALTSFGANKVGPVGRITKILVDQETPSGQKITSTAGVLGAAAGELAPAPISVGVPVRYALHAAAPQRFPEPRKGELLQRTFGAIGIKSQLATTDIQYVSRLADKFVKSNNLKFEPMAFQPTDEDSYAKLRSALRNSDFGSATKILRGLRGKRTDEQILKGMRMAAVRPFTGSHANEQQFLYSLDDHQLDVYFKANMQRAEDFQRFLEWFTTQ